LTTAAEFPGSEPLSKDAQEGYFVVDVGKEGVNEAETTDVWFPAAVPDGIAGTVSITADGLSGRCLCNAEISFELKSGGS
jgi:hypothetical protein